jgi:hypothetical protein
MPCARRFPSTVRELLPRRRAQAATGPPHSGIAGLACSANLTVLSVFGQEAKREKLAMLPFYFADLRVIKLPWFRHCHIAYSLLICNFSPAYSSL